MGVSSVWGWEMVSHAKWSRGPVPTSKALLETVGPSGAVAVSTTPVAKSSMARGPDQTPRVKSVGVVGVTVTGVPEPEVAVREGVPR